MVTENKQGEKAPAVGRMIGERNWTDAASEAAFELARRFVAPGHQITERPAMLGAGRLIELATQFPTVALDRTTGNPGQNPARRRCPPVTTRHCGTGGLQLCDSHFVGIGSAGLSADTSWFADLGIRTSQARSLGYMGSRPRPAERLGRSLVP